jgi:hypothetical protein
MCFSRVLSEDIEEKNRHCCGFMNLKKRACSIVSVVPVITSFNALEAAIVYAGPSERFAVCWNGRVVKWSFAIRKKLSKEAASRLEIRVR